MNVRPLQLRDLPGCYRVCVETSNADGGTRVWANTELLGHVYVGPYFFGPTATGFVLVDELGVAGYCFGAADTELFERWARWEWWPPLQTDYPADASYLEPEASIVNLLHAPHRTNVTITEAFPAHMHIDLLPRAQGGGRGRHLVELLSTQMVRLGASGIHLEVGASNTRAIGFYQHLGFTEVNSTDDALILAKALS